MKTQLLIRGTLAFTIGFIWGSNIGFLGMFLIGFLIGVIPWPPKP